MWKTKKKKWCSNEEWNWIKIKSKIKNYFCSKRNNIYKSMFLLTDPRREGGIFQFQKNQSFAFLKICYPLPGSATLGNQVNMAQSRDATRHQGICKTWLSNVGGTHSKKKQWPMNLWDPKITLWGGEDNLGVEPILASESATPIRFGKISTWIPSPIGGGGT